MFRKIVALALCLCLVFNLAISSQAAVGTGVITIASSGVGSMAAGSASILSGAIPVLAVLVAAGFLYDDIQQLADDVNYFFMSLSAAAAQKVATWAQQESFTVTSDVLSELNTLVAAKYYTDTGAFDGAQLTFDASSFLEYNFDAQFVYGQELTSSIYKTSLLASAQTLPGTTLTAQLVDSPMHTNRKALKIANASTGASLVLTHSELDKLDLTCGDMFISAPVVRDHATPDGLLLHEVGYWILSVCSSGQVGCEHLRPYSSVFIGEDYIDSFLMEGTGNVSIDGIPFNAPSYNDSISLPLPWSWPYATPMDGVSSLDMTYSPGQSVCADVGVLTRNPDYSMPVPDTLVYNPTADVLSDVGTLTADEVLTGDFTASESDSDTGLGIIGWLKKIYEAIVQGFKNVISFLNPASGLELPLLNIILELFNTIKDIVLGLWNFIADFFVTIGDNLRNFFNLIGDAGSELLGMFDSSKDTDGTFSGMYAFFQFIQNLWNCLPASIRYLIYFIFSSFALLGLFKMFH